ncbi:MAG: hypothetical protein V4439_01720 [Patescibacteria group bacterium]
MNNNFQKLLTSGIIVSLFFVFFGFYNSVSSSAIGRGSGYAWSANDGDGMGWLSFNCTSGGNCGDTNYEVTADRTTGDMTGYAWSPNYGWIKFGGLSGFPTGGGTTPANAKLDYHTGIMTGWARFCSVAATPSLCSGWPGTNNTNGGWDGWVSLNGTGYGVSKSGTNFTGFAWGGADVVGWIDFSNVSIRYPHSPASDPFVILTVNNQTNTEADPVLVNSGEPFVLRWDSENSSSCNGDWTTDALTMPAGSAILSVITDKPLPKTYTISCVGQSGTTDSVVNVSIVPSDVVNAVPKLNFYSSPNNYVLLPNTKTTLKWNSNVAMACKADNAIQNIRSSSSWSGNVGDLSASNSFQNSLVVDVPDNTPSTEYGIVCTDESGAEFKKQVYVSQQFPPEGFNIGYDAVDPTSHTTMLRLKDIFNLTSSDCTTTASVVGTGWDGTIKSDGSEVKTVTVPGSGATYTATCTGLNSGLPVIRFISLKQDSTAGSTQISPSYIEH